MGMSVVDYLQVIISDLCTAVIFSAILFLPCFAIVKLYKKGREISYKAEYNRLYFPVALLFIACAIYYIARISILFKHFTVEVNSIVPMVLAVAVPLLAGFLLFMKRRNIWLAAIFVLDIIMLICCFIGCHLNLAFGKNLTFGKIRALFGGSWLCEIVPQVLNIVASAYMVLLIFVNCKHRSIKVEGSKLAGICNKFWFIPGMLNAATTYVVFQRIRTWIDFEYLFENHFFDLFKINDPYGKTFSGDEINLMEYMLEFEGMPWRIVYAVALFLLGYWIVHPYKMERMRAYKTEDNAVNNVIDEEAYCSMGKHIVLCLFTFGIWPLIWIYRTTRFLNKAPNAEYYNPTSKLLLCIFVPFYQIYWLYKHGQRIDAISKEKNLNNSDMATLCLILGIFIPLIAYIIMQDRINTICTTKVEVEKEKTENSSIDQLKQYKELLDDGVITQEEFDAKKKQLLGL